MKALLKNLNRKGKNISVTKYYEYSQKDFSTEHLRDTDGKPFSALSRESIEHQCNSDQAILHAFKELLIDTYSPTDLKKLNICQLKNAIDTEAMEIDKDKIAHSLRHSNTEDNCYRYFSPRDLASANWLRN